LIRELIKKDQAGTEGGTGNFNPVFPAFQRLVEGLKQHQYHAVHISIPWHSVWAKRQGIELDSFKLSDYDIPVPYPAYVSLQDTISKKSAKLRSFLKATRRGHEELLRGDVKELANLLCDKVDHPNMKDLDFLQDSIRCIRDCFQREEEKKWGSMREEDWKRLVHFLAEKRLLVDAEGRAIKEDNIDVNELFTNSLLE